MLVIPNRRPGPSALRLEPLPEVLQRLLELGQRELAQDFRGITADGRVVPGLFPISRTGVTTERLAKAATAYLRSLTPDQRLRGSFEVKSVAWRQWCNVHPFLMRHGLCLRDLDASQREVALALVRESMSASGFETARNVMKLNDYVRELTGRTEEYDEWYYWISIMGAPSSSEPWGWQIDGSEPVLLQDPEPGRADRIRPPSTGCPRRRETDARPYSHAGAHAQWERLRCGPAPSAL
ncbi:MAG TPA: DUF3500 domain-containing protein [Stellaceae bacterium]|nr:DUF3500 domain-containing protein [Stellaceae bacterium]